MENGGRDETRGTLKSWKLLHKRKAQQRNFFRWSQTCTMVCAQGRVAVLLIRTVFLKMKRSRWFEFKRRSVIFTSCIPSRSLKKTWRTSVCLQTSSLMECWFVKVCVINLVETCFKKVLAKPDAKLERLWEESGGKKMLKNGKAWFFWQLICSLCENVWSAH